MKMFGFDLSFEECCSLDRYSKAYDEQFKNKIQKKLLDYNKI